MMSHGKRRWRPETDGRTGGWTDWCKDGQTTKDGRLMLEGQSTKDQGRPRRRRADNDDGVRTRMCEKSSASRRHHESRTTSPCSRDAQDSYSLRLKVL